MSKTEDRYLEYFQDSRLRNCSNKDAFLLGYHQATKDICQWLEDNLYDELAEDLKKYLSSQT